jgi:hypothetical protein
MLDPMGRKALIRQGFSELASELHVGPPQAYVGIDCKIKESQGLLEL